MGEESALLLSTPVMTMRTLEATMTVGNRNTLSTGIVDSCQFNFSLFDDHIDRKS
jgi:hypothetical protein